MNDGELKAARTAVEQVARRAGALVLEGYRTDKQVQRKGRIDLLTEYDLASEKLVLGELRRLFPGTLVVGEEADGPGVTGADDALTWYVDPIDGTTNFVHGHPFFCVSIGLCRGGVPLLGVVFAPALDVCWTGLVGHDALRNGEPCHVSDTTELGDALCATGFPYDRATSDENNFNEFLHFKLQTRGVRRCGSAALDLALTADGTYDAYWEFKLRPWDFAGGGALVLAAGGTVTNDTGGEVDLRTGAAVASNGHLHARVLTELRDARQGRPFPVRGDTE